MFIHKLGGSWLDHPFWKQAFLLNDAKQIRRIAQTGIHEIWIDTSKGLDVFVAPNPTAASAMAPATAPIPPRGNPQAPA